MKKNSHALQFHFYFRSAFGDDFPVSEAAVEGERGDNWPSPQTKVRYRRDAIAGFPCL